MFQSKSNRYIATLLLSTCLSALPHYGASESKDPEDLFENTTSSLTWEQRLENQRPQLRGNKHPHRNLLEERRLNTIAELLDVPVDSDTIQDRVEVDMQSDIVDTLSRLLDLLNPDRYTYDPEQIARVQTALIPQLYRLGHFRYDTALEYVRLADRFQREEPPEREGPIEVSASTVDPLPHVTRAPAKKWLEYLINRYHLRNNGDLPKIFNALTEFASTPRLLDQLERNLEKFLSAPHLRQLDYLRSQRFGAITSTEFGMPYLLPFQDLSTELPYATPLETFVSEGWLSRTLIPEDRPALERFYERFRNALEYQRLGEFVRTVLSPLEEVIAAPTGRELSAENSDFVCRRLYLVGAATVFDRIPKTLFQRETAEELQDTVGALRRFIPFSQLRNIGLMWHNADYLGRPRDRELLKSQLTPLIVALREIVPTMRRLVQEEVLLIRNGTTDALRFDIEEERSRHEVALTRIKRIGHFGSDIAIFAKLLRVLDAPLAQFRAPLSGWSDNHKQAFVRILVMVGESAKTLSSRARLLTGTDTFWKTFESIRDGIIHPDKEPKKFKERLELFLEDREANNDLLQQMLTEIYDMLGRMRLLYEHDEFTIDGEPDAGAISDTFGDHIQAFFDRVRNLALPAGIAARDPEQMDITAIAFEPRTDVDIAALDRTVNIARYEAQLSDLQELIRSHHFTEEFDALIGALPFDEGQKRKIQAIKTRYTTLNSLIEEMTPLLDDEAITDTFTEENRAAFRAFLTIEGVMDEAKIAEMQAVVDHLPDEEPDAASDEEEDEEEDTNPLAALMRQSTPHPLKEKFGQFVTKKRDFYQAIDAFAELNIHQAYEAFRNGLLSDEAFRNDLAEAAAIDIIDAAIEKELAAKQNLEERLRKFGIIRQDDIDLWFSELKKHYGLLLDSSNQRKRTLQRLFNSTLRLQRTLEQLRDETIAARAGEAIADIEQYWEDPLFPLRLESDFEELRHRVGGLSNALGIVYGLHPEIAWILQFHLENLRRLGNDLGHLGDVHGFATQSEQGKRFYLRRTLKILMGETPKGSISLIEILQRLNFILKAVVERGYSAEVAVAPTIHSNGDTLACAPVDGEAEPTSFRLEMIAPDGNCGFNALGIPRERAIEQLLRHADDEGIRASVADDIRQALLQGSLPMGMRTAVTNRLRTEYFHIQTRIDELRRQLGDIAPDVTVEWLQEEFLRVFPVDRERAMLLGKLRQVMQAIEALNGQINDYMNNQETYINFILQEFGRGAWLSYVRGGRGTLYALAQIYRLNVHIWRENREGQLERIPLADGLEGEEKHLLHTDGLTHFHRLRLLEEAETVSEHSDTLQVLSARINYNFAPAAVGEGWFQGGSSIKLASSSSLQGRIDNILNGFKFSASDECVEIVFASTIQSGQINITPNIQRQSSDQLSIILIKGSIFILKNS